MTFHLASHCRVVSSIRVWSCVPTLLAISCVCLSGITNNSLYAEDKPVHPGRELFEKEWTYEPPEMIEQGEGELWEQFVQRLRSLPGDGLGPMHNATSCEACHAGGGAAGVNRNVTMLTLDPRASFIKQNEIGKVTRNALLDLYPGLVAPTGIITMDVVVHEKSTRHFFEPIRKQLASFVPGGIADQWFESAHRTSDAIADKPVIAGRHGELDFYLSQRNSPPLFGLGLIDRIPRATLLTMARTQPRRTRGKVTGRLGTGKFGWRGQTFSLAQFVRGACAGELGLQVTGSPQTADIADDSYISVGLDMTDDEVNQLTSYVRSLPPPLQETVLPEYRVDIVEGERLFAKVGCSVCHVKNVHPAIGIYSDLLLHEMGSLLQAPSPAPPGSELASLPRTQLPVVSADPVPTPLAPLRASRFSSPGYYGLRGGLAPKPYEFARPDSPKFPRGELPPDLLTTRNAKLMTWDLLQREWRTPPLWGVADSAPYLHDGRAATLDAAIRWHGGEAAESAKDYRALKIGQREQVVAFLSSLRAPPIEPRAAKKSTVKPDQPADAPLAGVAAPAYQPGGLEEVIDVFKQGY